MSGASLPVRNFLFLLFQSSLCFSRLQHVILIHGVDHACNTHVQLVVRSGLKYVDTPHIPGVFITEVLSSTARLQGRA